jgi:hypothetical protein
MLGSITSLGERSRGRRWAVTHAWFLIGALSGGLLLGASLVALREAAALLPTPAVAAVALAGLAAVAVAAVRGRRPPSLHRQVDHRWLDRFRGWVVGVGFGFQLGAGVFTLIPSYALYLLALCALLGAPSPALLAAGVLYGGIRGLSATPGGWVRTTQQLQRLNQVSVRLQARSATVARGADVVGVAALAAALVTIAS